MNIEEFREHCLAVAGATESLPFRGHDVLVFKIMDKMFCMLALNPSDGVFAADLKCDPERSAELRERYAGIDHGHVKTTMLWNRITLRSDVPDELILELIRHSADRVVLGLTRAKRREYAELCEALGAEPRRGD